MSNDPERTPGSRRNFLKGLSLLPLAGAVAEPAAATPAPYSPSYLTAAEVDFLRAACDRLIPSDNHGPGAVELGVIEFIDRHMQTPYAAGDIWYRQGPYLQAAAEFGYQGRLAPRDILRQGIAATEAHCRAAFAGRGFSALSIAEQEAVLHGLESGGIALEESPAKLFFEHLLGETRYGYFADPKYGGNKDMAAWKMIGYPGVRADYSDWVEVRDRPYPLPPVDLSGRRG